MYVKRQDLDDEGVVAGHGAGGGGGHVAEEGRAGGEGADVGHPVDGALGRPRHRVPRRLPQRLPRGAAQGGGGSAGATVAVHGYSGRGIIQLRVSPNSGGSLKNMFR